MNRYEQLKANWVAQGATVNDSVNDEELSRFQSQLGVVLPHSFQAYLRFTNGMHAGHTDDYLIAFLSLEEIASQSHLSEVTPESVKLLFAEYSIYSHFYVLHFSRDGHELGVIASDNTNKAQIASSFDDFLAIYLKDPEAIAYCWI